MRDGKGFINAAAVQPCFQSTRRHVTPIYKAVTFHAITNILRFHGSLDVVKAESTKADFGIPALSGRP